MTVRDAFRAELKRLSNQCTPEKENACRKSLGQNLEAVCSQCEGNTQDETDIWFQHIWFLLSLQKGGYPFHRNELTIEEWIDIGILKDELELLQINPKQF